MKAFKRVCVVILVIAVIVAGFYMWHRSEMDSLGQQLLEEQASRDLMDQRIQDIQEKLNISESENDSLLEKLEASLAEEEVVFDSEAIMEEIREIGELATMEYRFTNVGTIDSVKKFSFVDWNVPFSRKTAVISMDGVVKVGIDVAEVDLVVDEASKTISIKLPEARILSTELFEDSMTPYIEEESLLSNITLEDNSSLREEIKTKAENNAVGSGLLIQARNQAGMLIRYLIEAVPGIKDTYTIVIQAGG